MEAPLCNLCITHLYGRDTSIQGTLFLIPGASPEWKLLLKFQVVGLMAPVGGESTAREFFLVLLYFPSIFLPK